MALIERANEASRQRRIKPGKLRVGLGLGFGALGFGCGGLGFQGLGLSGFRVLGEVARVGVRA